MNGKWQQNIIGIGLLFIVSSITSSTLAAPIERLNKPTFSSRSIKSNTNSDFKQAQAETEQPIEEATGQLTAENIRQVLTQIQDAGEQENVDEILEHVAPFAHSEVSLNMGNTLLTTTVVGIEEHRNLLTQSYNRFKNRKTLEQKVDISVSTDGEFGIATVYRLREVTNQEGTRLLSGSINTLRFGMVNEKPTIVSATLEGWLSERPSTEESEQP
ncbi:hypothetical protein [Myxosarcina sp. GI1]|uniref:hypothetical protein n=1 Tax=Myxosarcina sp. GI1 TaxID=1541065 RepID=UPI00055BB5DD|nr:hypothetical protein [Myxosarcina sp. GI1]